MSPRHQSRSQEYGKYTLISSTPHPVLSSNSPHPVPLIQYHSLSTTHLLSSTTHLVPLIQYSRSPLPWLQHLTLSPCSHFYLQLRRGLRPREATRVRPPLWCQRLSGVVDLAGSFRAAEGSSRAHGARACLPALLACCVWRPFRAVLIA